MRAAISQHSCAPMMRRSSPPLPAPPARTDPMGERGFARAWEHLLIPLSFFPPLNRSGQQVGPLEPLEFVLQDVRHGLAKALPDVPGDGCARLPVRGQRGGSQDVQREEVPRYLCCPPNRLRLPHACSFGGGKRSSCLLGRKGSSHSLRETSLPCSQGFCLPSGRSQVSVSSPEQPLSERPHWSCLPSPLAAGPLTWHFLPLLQPIMRCARMSTSC